MSKDWQTLGLTLAFGCYVYGVGTAERDLLHQHKVAVAIGYLLAAAIGGYAAWRTEARCAAAEKALREFETH